MYLVDANVLIEAKNRYYAFDIVPGFWAWLDRVHGRGVACSIDSVREELLQGDDELAEWAAARRDFFRPIDQKTAARFGALTEWVVTRRYRQSAINAFTGKDADFQLIAYGMAHDCTVATLEKSMPSARKRVLIPDACLAMGVSTADTFTMMRKTGARLVLEPDTQSAVGGAAPAIPGIDGERP